MDAPKPKMRKMRQNKERVGLLIVNTGNGKGKSTASFGMAMRAAGHGMTVHIIQFIKGSRDAGELKALDRFEEITIHRAGEGFTWEVRSDDRQKELANWGMDKVVEAINNNVDLIILDEVNIVLDKGFYDIDAFLEIIQSRPEEMHVCCTGRRAPEKLIQAAHLATEMTLLKHPYKEGIKAQAGIEF
jgi:cob(I)alamin adenosyltransferase